MDLMTNALLLKLVKLIQEDKVVRFYQSSGWRKLRDVCLRMHNYRCVQCSKKAEMVHHIKKVKDYPQLALRLSNVEPLCNSCHNKEHPEKLQREEEKKFSNQERW